ncbi:DUF5994 family protein [Mycolicibacterium fluoranthenivorans]|uniref:Uncharacterized protein n=1 Tax=Mycolicibacterium fluoranthenivorans TaxID=258505 RepID=A0A7X5U586_9MYCO|nr:DUF5994 family protein [Mycolicibacterium fluoranthenivorans]MCV7354739.1 hypothetical protein [Mycolicibacterium fluoranthenivorans]NIH98671.1 hypothetical protein [Mycolicibacterium fluoranthenivorans]
MADDDAHAALIARLALSNHPGLQGTVAGAWWPSDRQLGTGLADLVAVLGLRIGPVRRVLYDPIWWDTAPARLIRGSTSVPVDAYSLIARDTLYLMGTHNRHSLLFVVPPAATELDARLVLAAVATAASPPSVQTLRAILGGGRARQK